MSKSVQQSKRTFFWLNWGIRAKFASIIIVVLLITVVSFAIVIQSSLNQNTRQATAQGYITLSNQILLRLAGGIKESLISLKTMALSPSIIEEVERANFEHEGFTEELISDLDQKWKDSDPGIESMLSDIENNEASRDLKIFLAQFPEEVEVFVTDAAGLNIAMTDRTSDYLQADEDWWNVAYNNGAGAIYIGDVEYDESSKVYAMNIGVPVYDRQHNEAIGVLRGTVNVTAIFETLSTLSLVEGAHPILLDKNNSILYSPNKDLFLQPAPENIVNMLGEGETGWSTNQIDELGQAGVMGYSSTSEDIAGLLGWKLIIAQSEETIGQSAGAGQLVIILVAVLMVAIGLFLSNIISKQIKQITSSVKRLAAGDLSTDDASGHSLEEFSAQKDEIGEMNRASLDLYAYMKDMVNAAEKVASGDLTLQIDSRSKNDALGNAFQQMITRLKQAVTQVSENSMRLSETSSHLASSAHQAGNASAQIAQTIQEVARGTTQQTDSITRTASSVDQLTKAIEGVAIGAQEQATAVSKASTTTNQINLALQQVAQNTKAMRSDSENAAKAAREGTEIMGSTISGMQTIKNKVGHSAKKVEEMGARSDQIGAIVQVIEDIASQTNLLALNAAIEAARAGEHGKGFAVVADEVRKLAERSSSSTKEIGSLIKGIQEIIADAVSSMEEGATEVEQGVLRANLAGEALDSILKAAEAVTTQARETARATEEMSKAAAELMNAMDSVSAVVEENTAATEQMSASSTEVSQSIENIASVSEENSAAVEEVSAATEEMSAQVQEVTETSQTLDRMAQTLQEVVNRFKLR